MKMEISGRLNVANGVTTAHGNEGRIRLAVPVGETDMGKLYTFLPAAVVGASFHVGDTVIATVEGQVKTISGAATKDGTFATVVIHNELDPVASGKLQKYLGDTIGCTLEIDPDKNEPDLVEEQAHYGRLTGRPLHSGSKWRAEKWRENSTQTQPITSGNSTE